MRPLIEDGSGKPEAATRGYRIDLDTDEQALMDESVSHVKDLVSVVQETFPELV